jgi:hypothetical protein
MSKRSGYIKIVKRRVNWLEEKIASRKANEQPYDLFGHERDALLWLIEERDEQMEPQRFLTLLVAEISKTELWSLVSEDLRAGIVAHFQKDNPGYVPEPERAALRAKNIARERQKFRPQKVRG